MDETMDKKRPLSDLMRSTMDKIREMADTNTIVGQPITTPDGVTLIPISRVSMGFGCGGADYGKTQPKDFGGGITVRARGDRPGRRVHKQYVDVYARANADGTMVPIRVCWPDGRCFTIDQILEIEPFGAIVQNAQTATYTVRFGQWRTQLMLEHYHEEDDIHGAEDHLRWWVWAFDNTLTKNDVEV